MRQPVELFETEIEGLDRGGLGIGRDPKGRRVNVRFAPPGARVLACPTGRGTARRLALVRPPPDAVTPVCPHFGTCGGCALQDLPLDAQRVHKVRWAVAAGAPDATTVVHSVRGDTRPYGFRNRLELSFGTRRWLSEEEVLAGVDGTGRLLGFHPPGRFDRLVDIDACAIASPALAVPLQVVRRMALADGAPPTWDARAHTGFWRHLGLRVGEASSGVLVALHTASPDEAAEAAVEALVAELTPLVAGVAWFVFDGVADAAIGTLRKSWGAPRVRESLGGVDFAISHRSFFQTTTAGAEVLLATVIEALGPPGDRLYDLYCGTGALSLPQAARYRSIVGIEEVAPAVEDAVAAAKTASISHATFVCGKVEAELARIDANGAHVLVDPPRAGLHPKVALALAACAASHLVYVACHPPSLGRDGAVLRAAGWRMTDLWPVDLFPQTGHMELVARFERTP